MPKHSRVSHSLEPVKHLSVRLQHKLVKREARQRKQFRSSGKPYPLALDMPGTEEQRSVPAAASSFTRRQRVALALASLVVVMLVTFGLAWIAVATHVANGIGFLLLLVVALLTSAAVLFNLVVNRKP